MIRKVIIKNFKSITELELDLGRFNIFIGANGSGKSNILEAIAFAEATATNKLDNEFLASRGIRVTEPQLVKPAFDLQKVKKESISISIQYNNGNPIDFIPIYQDNPFYPGWSAKLSGTDKLQEGLNTEALPYFTRQTELHKYLKGYLIYAPDEQTLRGFKAESPILPLGRNSEGLFKLLTVMNEVGSLIELKEHLSVLDWYENFEIGNGNFESERFLEIKDRYLDKELKFFDQRSANEGFLFLLFYFALFISKHTPAFFAIENIETSLNPKLCRKLIEVLTDLAAKHNKQAIVTTHNPGVLDGLNISDDEQRLFVVERNLLGHTIVRRIKMKEGKTLEVKLSQAFVNGYLGGLPNNF